jgi:hypothetical protein
MSNYLRALLTSIFLGSGAALVAYILSGISLLWTFVAFVSVSVVILAVALQKMSDANRSMILIRVAVGAVSGLAATLAYDLVRLSLVEFGRLDLRPFETWRMFGVGLVGGAKSDASAMAAGTAFHFYNGVTFGIAYTIAFGRRGAWAGILWALALEAIMVSLYPSWLDMKALGEFLSVSVIGHIVYGSVLGSMAKRLLARRGADEPVFEQPPPSRKFADEPLD